MAPTPRFGGYSAADLRAVEKSAAKACACYLLQLIHIKAMNWPRAGNARRLCPHTHLQRFLQPSLLFAPDLQQLLQPFLLFIPRDLSCVGTQVWSSPWGSKDTAGEGVPPPLVWGCGCPSEVLWRIRGEAHPWQVQSCVRGALVAN